MRQDPAAFYGNYPHLSSRQDDLHVYAHMPLPNTSLAAVYYYSEGTGRADLSDGTLLTGWESRGAESTLPQTLRTTVRTWVHHIAHSRCKFVTIQIPFQESPETF